MDQFDLLKTIAAVLQGMRIPYFVTGSIASSHYGEVRATNDIGVVVDLKAEQVRLFCEQFPEPEYYVSEEAGRGAVARRSQFNIIHIPTASKIDVIVQDASAFDQMRFERSRVEKYLSGAEVRLASPEDVIVKKLVYYKEGGSDKHLRDVAGILRISGDRVDRKYVEYWASHFGVLAEWRETLGKEPGLP